MTEVERREQGAALRQLRRDARTLASHFELTLRRLDPERPNVKRRYGICYSDGSIRIRLRHATTGRLLKYSSLVDTLCHELAHLRYFDHGPRFKLFYQRILTHARRAGIYRPAPRTADGRVPTRGRRTGRPVSGPPVERERRPIQLDLFG